MKINKEFLIDLVSGYESSEKFEIVKNKICDQGRWSTHYDAVLFDKETGKYWDVSYQIGSTEMQDEVPFENEDTDENGDMQLTNELEPYEEMVINYRSVKKVIENEQ